MEKQITNKEQLFNIVEKKFVMREIHLAGVKVGMLRPITLWPFPSKPIAALCKNAKAFVVFEMSAGQMVEDVKLAVNGARPVYFHGRTGGMLPTPKELYEQIITVARGEGGKQYGGASIRPARVVDGYPDSLLSRLPSWHNSPPSSRSH